jgi:hypothetical protein
MGFNYLFWGILFSFFDFRIQGIDILPDIIGFILIFNGANKLVHISERFSVASKFAIPLMVLSIFDIYQRPHPGGGMEFQQSMIGMLVGLAIGVLIIILFYHICKGIEEKALELGLHELAQQAMNRWTFLLVFECVVIIFPFIFLMSLGLASILFIMVFILAIVTLILLMMLMKSAQNQFPEDIGY